MFLDVRPRNRGARPIARRPRAAKAISPGTAAGRAGIIFVAVLSVMGCQRQLDMADAYDRSRAATTIPYTGVREATRQYPDYGAVNGSILTKAPADGPSPAGKGKPMGAP